MVFDVAIEINSGLVTKDENVIKVASVKQNWCKWFVFAA
jgi:hypothetical protein